MAGTLKDIAALESEIDSAGFGGINKDSLLDVLKSLAKVAGTLSVKQGVSPDQDFTLGATWTRIDVWERSIDTQGVQDGLGEVSPEGWYKIKDGGAGDYSAAATMRFAADLAGTYELRVLELDDVGTKSTTPYHDEVTLGAGETGHMAIAPGIIKGLVATDKLQLEMRGPTGAVITVTFAQFAIWR